MAEGPYLPRPPKDDGQIAKAISKKQKIRFLFGPLEQRKKGASGCLGLVKQPFVNSLIFKKGLEVLNQLEKIIAKRQSFKLMLAILPTILPVLIKQLQKMDGDELPRIS